MKLRTLSAIGVAVVVTAAGVVVSTGLANADESYPDLAIGMDKLRFRPPAEIPDIGTSQVRVANVGGLEPSFVRVSFQTGGLIDFVATDVQGMNCNASTPVNDRNVVICSVPTGYLEPGESLVANVTVQLGSPPPAAEGEVPQITVHAVTRNDPTLARATASIGR